MAPKQLLKPLLSAEELNYIDWLRASVFCYPLGRCSCSIITFFPEGMRCKLQPQTTLYHGSGPGEMWAQSLVHSVDTFESRRFLLFAIITCSPHVHRMDGGVSPRRNVDFFIYRRLGLLYVVRPLHLLTK